MPTRFEIGEDEKHVLEAEVSRWGGNVRVIIDGREVLSKKYVGATGWGSFVFQVGEKEKHSVELRVFRIGRNFELLVDGKLQGEI